MLPYKMIVSDIDGTFLTTDHRVSERTKEAVRRVVEKGVPVILASGRMPSAVRLIQNEAGLSAPFISYSGALLSAAGGKTLGGTGLSKQTAVKAQNFVSRFFPDVECSAYSEDRWIVGDDTTPLINSERAIIKRDPEKGDLSLLLDDAAVVHKLLCIGNAERLDEMRAKMSPLFPECRIYKSQARYLEIMEKSACKSAAAALLCRQTGILPQETLAFGDNYNDIDLLEFAGTGIAMGNAPADVQSRADEIADTNDNDGFAKCLEKIFAL